MTRRFGNLVNCPHCGRSHTAETAVERWIRNCRELDSIQAGIARFDIDVLMHRYLTLRDKRGTRLVQAIMFLEIKTLGAELADAQQDTLGMLSQVLRNRRRNMYRDKRGRHLGDHSPLASAYSHMMGRRVRLRMFGGHLLRLSGTSPTDSDWMTWDNKRINVHQLIALLRFDLDPDTLRPIDWRRRSGAFGMQRVLFS